MMRDMMLMHFGQARLNMDSAERRLEEAQRQLEAVVESIARNGYQPVVPIPKALAIPYVVDLNGCKSLTFIPISRDVP